MLTLEKDQLVIRFPEVHEDAECTIEFQRTLRIPDDNNTHSLPPGLGRFPLFHVDDYASRLPAEWSKHGGVFLPMYQAEAMWIRFHSRYPFAVKIATGKINAVSGETWKPELSPTRKSRRIVHDMLARPPLEQAEYMAHINAMQHQFNDESQQDYMVIPKQPWLDGFNVGKGRIRQFVAMPLGEGYTVEEQITGEALHGGLQIMVYPIKPQFYERPHSALRGGVSKGGFWAGPQFTTCSLTASSTYSAQNSAVSVDMGLAPGGLMKQKIYEDNYGFEKWDQAHSAKCFVHLMNSRQFERVTGKRPPTQAPTAAEYSAAGLPWFDTYDEFSPALPGAEKLQKLDSVANLGNKKGETPLPENTPVLVPLVTKVIKVPNEVRQGQF